MASGQEVISGQKERSISLPRRGGSIESVSTTKNLLFVGANGSGKTRLGTWLEMESSESGKVLRVSAQKSLSMPDSTTPMSIEMAERNLLFGNPEHVNNKAWYKWQNKPATSLLNDYEKLMVYLFSDETEENAKYKVSQRASSAKIEPPLTKLDRVKQAWERILPHRELIVGGLRIQTQVRGDSSKIYNSSDMSDGERVIFYLLGQCLAAPKDGIIVIDEPELHLHKSVQAPLWAELEKLRPDCLFVYLTHDVDFAAAQEGAQKIWLKSFDGTTWEWELIDDSHSLPNELLIEVLGSRKPVVFVEGKNGSYDVSLYREVLSNFLVLPAGSCAQVIQSVKALRGTPQLHHLEVFGLVDRDRRQAAEVAALESDGIYTLTVAEVENLFCTKDVLHIVSTRLARDPAADFDNVVNYVFKQLQAELDTQVSLRVGSEIRFKLNNFDVSIIGEAALAAALETLVNSIDVSAMYSQFGDDFRRVISENDYEALLGLYNRKSMASQICSALGLKKDELSALVIRLARSDERHAVAEAIKKCLGNFAAKVA